MNLRIVGCVLAVTLLLTYRVVPGLTPRKSPSTPASPPDRWSLFTLVLASALTLFAELALIRWVATEVRIFAYVKNLALLLCFLGFGLGCALARQPARWLTAARAFLGLILVVRLPWLSAQVMEGLSQSLGAGQDIQICGNGLSRNWTAFLLATVLTTS